VVEILEVGTVLKIEISPKKTKETQAEVRAKFLILEGDLEAQEVKVEVLMFSLEDATITIKLVTQHSNV